MELLRADERPHEPGERVFRHSPLGPLVALLCLLTPLVLALGIVQNPAGMGAGIGTLPWFAWLGLAPLLFCGALLYALVLAVLGGAALASLRPSNWLVRVSPAGLVLNLRSYQNAHFPHDGPTVVRIPWSEVARVREVREAVEASHDEGVRTMRWLQIELAGADTRVLERLVTAERERKGPETRRLGVTTSGRSGHVPVFVASAGILRTDWLGVRVLGALAAHATRAERLTLDTDAGDDLATRLDALLRRGDRMAAVVLARRELGLSLAEARAHVRDLARQVA